MAEHPVVGTGSESFWHRRTNTYPGCTCPPWRYNPSQPKPTDPDCTKHGRAKRQNTRAMEESKGMERVELDHG